MSVMLEGVRIISIDDNLQEKRLHVHSSDATSDVESIRFTKQCPRTEIDSNTAGTCLGSVIEKIVRRSFEAYFAPRGQSVLWIHRVQRGNEFFPLPVRNVYSRASRDDGAIDK